MTYRSSSDLLSDPGFHVPTASPGSSAIARFRLNVCRFANGEAHDRRRAIAEQLIGAIDPFTLQQAARERVRLGTAWNEAPVATLASALGVAEKDLGEVAHAIATIAHVYRASGSDVEEAAASDAVTWLYSLFGDEGEGGANLIGVLVQAHAATVALVENTWKRSSASSDVRASIAETLQTDPPVPSTVRVAPTGEHVVVPLAGESAFGLGFRACPGRDHALAIAAGVIEGRCLNR